MDHERQKRLHWLQQRRMYRYGYHWYTPMHINIACRKLHKKKYLLEFQYWRYDTTIYYLQVLHMLILCVCIEAANTQQKGFIHNPDGFGHSNRRFTHE